MARLRVGVLISGRGSNLRALIAAAADPAYPAEIVTVISNRANAPGLAHAQTAGIAHHVIADPERAAFAVAADKVLRTAEVELVALAGFMRLLDAGFVEAWSDRMINIHPSLLPLFPGLHPQRQALAAGVKFSGCTVHFVRVAVDSGPIVAQAVVPVEDGDDEARLAARILAVEHRLYPLAVRLFAEKRLRIASNRVAVIGSASPDIAVLNPTEAIRVIPGRERSE
jgi:phosphoribosylglycinamide formyltransferase-1